MSAWVSPGNSGVRVAFLDRDGTVIEDRHSLHRPEQVALLPDVLDGLRILEGAGFAIVIVTNQSGVARGQFTEEDIRDVHDFLGRLLLESSMHVRGFFYCPHHQEGVLPAYTRICDCRKPEPGLARQAESVLGPIAYPHSWSIGDKPSDVQFGQGLGMNTALIRSEYWMTPPIPRPTLIVVSLFEAAQRIRTQGSSALA